MTVREMLDDQTKRILGNLSDLDDKTQLTLKDLPYLRMAMTNVAIHWYNIGIHFHISTSDLDKFRSKNRNDSDSCLTCVLVEWLKNWNSKYGPPTWRKVVIAVSSRVGGDNPAEASRIGKKYKEYGTVSSFKDADRVDDRPLSEEHLKFIVVYLMEVATCWASIGLFLGIPYKFIEVCKLEDSLEQSISTMVETWLRRKHDTTAFGEPTYRRLAEAVASRSGGGNLRLAEMIAKDHPLCYGADVPPQASGQQPTAQQTRLPNVFTEGDLALLMNLLDPVAFKWDLLCLQLGVPQSDLNNIVADPMRLAGAPRTHLHDGLYVWIKKGGSNCTVLALCDALEEASVDEPVLASELRMKLNNRGS